MALIEYTPIVKGSEYYISLDEVEESYNIDVLDYFVTAEDLSEYDFPLFEVYKTENGEEVDLVSVDFVLDRFAIEE